MSSQKFNQSSSSPFAPLPSNCNILQPKRLNNNNNISPGDTNTGRRVLGQKGQLPSPLSLSTSVGANGISHLSNQQLTTLLRNNPILVDQCNSNSNGTALANLSLSGECASVPISISKRAPNTMAKRNARERNRVKQVNQGFQTLRQHIPDSYRMKKMSKVDTLRCALDYIRNLERILQLPEGESSTEFVLLSPTTQSSATSVSPSTSSLMFSSEEDELFVHSPYHHTHQHHHPQQHGMNNQTLLSANTLVDKISKNSQREDESPEIDDPFGSTHRIISSYNNHQNNDENNLQNLKLSAAPIKAENNCDDDADDDEGLSSSTTGDNNYRIHVIPIPIQISVSSSQMVTDANANNVTTAHDIGDVGDVEMGIITPTSRGAQSQGHLSDGHSDTENYHEENSSEFIYC